MMNVKKYINKIFAVFLILSAVIGIQVMHTSISADAATIGQPLTQPESGWKRYNDKDIPVISSKNASLEGTGDPTGRLSCYHKDYTYVGAVLKDVDGTHLEFKFKGSKIRIIGGKSTCRSNKILINIDGEENRYNLYSNTATAQCLVFEKNNLDYREHTVVISVDGTTESFTHDGKVGKAFDVDAVDIDNDGYLIPKSQVLDVEAEKDEITLNENVAANVVIDNIAEIAAEDIRIKYDSTKLQFLGMEESAGIKIVKSEENADELRVIAASQGKENIVNAKKILLKLNFKGIAVGDALVDITKGRVSDGIDM